MGPLYKMQMIVYILLTKKFDWNRNSQIGLRYEELFDI